MLKCSEKTPYIKNFSFIFSIKGAILNDLACSPVSKVELLLKWRFRFIGKDKAVLVLLAGVNHALLHNMLPYLIIEKFFENFNWRLFSELFFYFLHHLIYVAFTTSFQMEIWACFSPAGFYFLSRFFIRRLLFCVSWVC